MKMDARTRYKEERSAQRRADRADRESVSELTPRLSQATGLSEKVCWHTLYVLSPDKREAYIVLHEEGKGYRTQQGSSFYFVDPIELDPTMDALLQEVHEEVAAELKDEPRVMGFCYLYWRTTQRILREKHGIDWRSPHQLNSHIHFD
jgi:hypothetical protein